jgi:hypothetical protein
MPDRRALVHRAWVGPLFAVAALAPTWCAAAPTLTVVSTPSTLDRLTVGASVRVDVMLSGLASGDAVETVGARVKFDGAVMGTPTIAPGPIVSSVEGFVAVEAAGSGEASYDQLFGGGALIRENGLLYSMEITVEALGRGAFTLAFGELTGSDSSGEPLAPVTLGAPVPFSPRAGDANGDLNVDFDDLVTLAQNYNTLTGTALWTDGDFTGDGSIDFLDLVQLAQNYGASSVAGLGQTAQPARVVPEPRAGALVAAGAIIRVSARRSRRR